MAILAHLADSSKATPTPDPSRSIERPETPLGQRLVFEALIMGVEYAYASAVPGHIAEFGTMSGATATTLAAAMRDGDQRYRLSEQSHGIGERSLYLFDSFQGFPKTNNPVDAASPHVATNVWGPGVARGLTAEELHDACSAILGRDRVKVTPGWYNETLPTFSSDLRFAVVSIDCDLYESTASVLEYLLGQADLFRWLRRVLRRLVLQPRLAEVRRAEGLGRIHDQVQHSIHRLGAVFRGWTQVHPASLNVLRRCQGG